MNRRTAKYRKWHAEYQRDWYSAHATTHKALVAARNLRLRAEVRQLVIKAKDKPCADCGHSYPYPVMDFDHLGDDKLFDIGGAGHGWSLEKVMAEISKCEVVCSNCHRMRTWNRKQHQKNQPIKAKTSTKRTTQLGLFQ